MTIEIILLATTGIVASVLYISKHLITSTCWSKENCCAIKLRANSQSNINNTNTEQSKTIISSIV